MMQPTINQLDHTLSESKESFDLKASDVLIKACLECLALTGLLIMAVFTTLIVGL